MTTTARTCACCGLDVAALIETAHVPNRRAASARTLDLCVLCHRAYDLGLTPPEKIEVAFAERQAGRPAPFTREDLLACWRARAPDWSILQQGAQQRGGRTLRRKSAAKRAAATRARRRAAMEGDA